MQDCKLTCPECHAEGQDNFRKAGFKQLYQRRLQLYQCKKCGAEGNLTTLRKHFGDTCKSIQTHNLQNLLSLIDFFILAPKDQ